MDKKAPMTLINIYHMGMGYKHRTGGSTLILDQRFSNSGAHSLGGGAILLYKAHIYFELSVGAIGFHKGGSCIYQVNTLRIILEQFNELQSPL
jgi:hypothetical protein